MDTLCVDDKVRGLLAEALQIPATKISDDLAMKDVEGWDSLKHVEIVSSLETIFDLELTFDEIIAMRSLREIKRVLKERGVAS